MDGMRFVVPVHCGGALAADQQGVIRLACPATLVAVTAGATNAADSTLKVGTPADDDGVLTAQAVGQTSAPAAWERGDFDGALVAGDQLWHGANGDRLTWFLDFDGAAGTAGQNVDLAFWFLEG